ncbi:DNA-directed RNA polymerase I subunit RPA12 [Pancytospora philotis]|nr:DNA-directed RNA polymerase I subunit RPA12 [Pancytospora philotis]
MFCKCKTMIHLPMLVSEPVKCVRCGRVLESPDAPVVSTVKHFAKREEAVQCERVGAKIDKKCPKCGSRQMEYSTAQLRSADEGQTVFYSCSCGYKQTVHS